MFEKTETKPDKETKSSDWSNVTEYNKGDKVFHNYKNYQALVDNEGSPPEYTPKDWELIPGDAKPRKEPVITTSTIPGTPAVEAKPATPSKTVTTTTVENEV